MCSTSVSSPDLKFVLREASPSGKVNVLTGSPSSEVYSPRQGGILVGFLGPRSLSTSLVGQLRGLNPNSPSSFTIAFNVLRAQIMLLRRRIKTLEKAYSRTWDINKRLGLDYNDLIRECNTVRKSYHDNKIQHRKDINEHRRKVLVLESDNRLLKLQLDSLKEENERKDKKIAAQRDKLAESSILFESMVDIKIYGSVLHNAVRIFDWEGKAEDALIRAILEACTEEYSPWYRVINAVIASRNPVTSKPKPEASREDTNTVQLPSESVGSLVQNMVAVNSPKVDFLAGGDASATLKTQRLNKTGTVKVSTQDSSQTRQTLGPKSLGTVRASISHRRSASIQRNEGATPVKVPRVFLQPKVSPPAPTPAYALVCPTSCGTAPTASLLPKTCPVSTPHTKCVAPPLLPSSIASPKTSGPNKITSRTFPPKLQAQAPHIKHTPTSPIRSRLATHMTSSYKRPILESVDLNRLQAHTKFNSTENRVEGTVAETTIAEDIPKSLAKSRGKRNAIIVADKLDLASKVMKDVVLSPFSLPGAASGEVVSSRVQALDREGNSLTPQKSSVSPSSKTVACLVEFSSDSDRSLEESGDSNSDSDSVCSRLREIREIDRKEDKEMFAHMRRVFARKEVKPVKDSTAGSSSRSSVTDSKAQENLLEASTMPPAPAVIPARSDLSPSRPISILTPTPARPICTPTSATFQTSTSKISSRDISPASNNDAIGNITTSTSGSSYLTSSITDTGAILTSVETLVEAQVVPSTQTSVKPVKMKLGFFGGLGRRFARVGTTLPATPLKKEVSGGALTPQATPVSKPAVVSSTKCQISGPMPVSSQPGSLALRQKLLVSSTEGKRESLISPRVAPKPLIPSSSGLPIPRSASSSFNPPPFPSSRRPTLLPPQTKLSISHTQLPTRPFLTTELRSSSGKSFIRGPGPNLPPPPNSKVAHRSTPSQSVKPDTNTGTIIPPIVLPMTKHRSQTNNTPLSLASPLSPQVGPFVANAYAPTTRSPLSQFVWDLAAGCESTPKDTHRTRLIPPGRSFLSRHGAVAPA